MAISEIEVGDTVLAYNEATGETGEYLVTATIAHHDPTVVYLTISGEMLTTTDDEKYIVELVKRVTTVSVETVRLVGALTGLNLTRTLPPRPPLRGERRRWPPFAQEKPLS
ncbi:MAG: polymorphic toxin-type HINT domain-containing protein [Anaerolineae bacterium]|nr:polymorphic toxin-type HINT domain-containing protein [Anaerolineae bacterium]